MKFIDIKTLPQDNGIWGAPLAWISCKDMGMLSDEYTLLHSAILMAIAEKFTNNEFSTFTYTNDGFFLQIHDVSFYAIKYKHYELIGNTLVSFNPSNMNVEYPDTYYDLLLNELVSRTFHQSDETAKPIVDEFLLQFPQILNRYTKEYLYTI